MSIGTSPARASSSPDREFAESVLKGLSLPRKRLDSKYLYDAEGSRLFERICALEEYYPTRTETAILRERAPEIVRHVPPEAVLVELGSGSSTKTRILLDAMPSLAAYVPVDISADHLLAAASALRRDYPGLAVLPAIADFTEAFDLPAAVGERPRFLFFPGSTIGNFEAPEARALLGRLRRIPNLAGLVIGADLRKDIDRLVRAYDDAEGVTAAFNLNILARINREIGSDFDLSGFAHRARWNEAESRIEMHLESIRPQTVNVLGRRFSFERGETIHTENSHKFTVAGFAQLAASAGWATAQVWTDDDRLFSVHVLKPLQTPSA